MPHASVDSGSMHTNTASIEERRYMAALPTCHTTAAATIPLQPSTAPLVACIVIVVLVVLVAMVFLLPIFSTRVWTC